MNRVKKLTTLAGLCFIASAPFVSNTTVAEEATSDLQTLIEERQFGFKMMGRNIKSLRIELKKDTPDYEVMKKASMAIQTEAKKLPVWFPAGSGQESGIMTDSLAYIWKNPDKFYQFGKDLELATQSMIESAEAADKSASLGHLKAIKASCSGCHQSFRAD